VVDLNSHHSIVQLVSSVAERVKAPFLWRPCDQNLVI